MFPDTGSAPLILEGNAPAWPLWIRVLFRFALVYWALYLLPSAGAMSLVDLLPWLGDKLNVILGWPMHVLAPWVGRHLFHLSGPASDWHSTGSGDTAMNYMVLVIGLSAAFAGSAIWSLSSEVRGKCREYTIAYAWLRLVLRFTLAVTLLLYGFIKIFPGQFGPLGVYGLSEAYGDSTPMHLLWTFMGQSRPYMIFGGLMEAVPGALLLFRRTSTAGLLGAAAVMLNVVMLNFCYDVPVKLYSVHLLLMALFLLLPDARPLYSFLLKRQPARLTGVWIPPFERKALRIGAHVLQGLVIVGALYTTVWSSYEQTRTTQTSAAASPLEGMYAVDEAQGLAADKHWTQVFFEDRRGKHYLGMIGPDRIPTRIIVNHDVSTRTISTISKESPATLHWTKDGSGELTLTGTFKAANLSMKLHRTSPATYALNERGFHWVSEDPYNH